jgi:hypothetical protein
MTLLLLLLACLAFLALPIVWAVSRLLRADHQPSGVDPILGARNQVAIYRPGSSFIRPHPAVAISMPDDLKTNQDMVVWMTKELPKAVAASLDRRL